MLWSLNATAAGLVLLSTLSAGADAQASADAVPRAISGLGAAEYSTRQEATEQLKKLGLAAVPQLLEATKSPSRETAIRATEVLADLYRTAKFPAAAIVEEAISDLRTRPGAIGDLAEQSWNANASPREVRTVAQIEALGARVHYRTELTTDEPAPKADRPPPIQFISISRKWKGGDEGLKLLARLSGREEIQVYHVNGAQVSEEAMEGVIDLGFRVDRRGAFLGISSGNASMLFAQREGCNVGAVTKDSPAAVAGMQPGDRIVRFNDQPIADFEELITLLKATEPGEKVEVGVIREGQPLGVKVELGDW